MATLQMNPMSAPNPPANPIPNNNWFQMAPQSTGLPVPQPGAINPFMTAAPIPAGVPFGNNFGSFDLNSGQMFPQSDTSSSQWAFNGNNSLNQSSGVTASTNLWQ